MVNMKAAVIINTFSENPNVLKRAVDSYRNQTTPVQIIISTVEGDVSIESRDKFNDCDFSILPLKHHPGKSPAGAYVQINHALNFINPSVEWLCYASGNDTAENFKIAIEMDACLNSRKQVCYSAFNYVGPDGGHISTQPLPAYDYNLHLGGNFVSDCSLISMRLAEKYLPYKTQFGNFAHWDSWLRIYEGEGNVFFYNDVPTWNYHQNPDDMSKQRKTDEQRAAYLEEQVFFIKNRK